MKSSNSNDLASLVKMTSLFKAITTTTPSTTSSTSTPFSMPYFFGALLTAAPATTNLDEDIFDPITDNPMLEESTRSSNLLHQENGPSIVNIKDWYVQTL